MKTGLSGVATDLTSYISVVKAKAAALGATKLYKRATPIIVEAFKNKVPADKIAARLAGGGQ